MWHNSSNKQNIFLSRTPKQCGIFLDRHETKTMIDTARPRAVGRQMLCFSHCAEFIFVLICMRTYANHVSQHFFLNLQHLRQWVPHECAWAALFFFFLLMPCLVLTLWECRLEHQLVFCYFFFLFFNFMSACMIFLATCYLEAFHY